MLFEVVSVNMHLIIASTIVEAIQKGTPEFSYKFVALDLASVASIEQAAKEINALNLPVHVRMTICIPAARR